MRPPPPTATSTLSTSGTSSQSSRPTPPWPAMTSGSAKGWMKVSGSPRQRSSARLGSYSSPDPPCPHCGKPALRRLVSTFATVSSGDSGGDDDFGGGGDAFGGEGGDDDFSGGDDDF